MLIKTLEKAKLITPPHWLADNCIYLTQMGSVAYGLSTDKSDLDIYGICVPRKFTVFPHLSGSVCGFGTQPEKFDQYQQHHVEFNKKVYDLTIYNIVRYFQLLMENNPNMIDSIFTPQTCVLHSTQISEFIRHHRKDFLHKGMWFKFKAYAFSQMHKMRDKNPIGKRVEIRDKFGYDVKFAYHLVRLLYEAEMVLIEGDIDLQRHREHLKAIRNGEVKEEDIYEWASAKEKTLEIAYSKSTLQEKPNEELLKGYLLTCLEMHYKSLPSTRNISLPNLSQDLIRLESALADVNKKIGQYLVAENVSN